MDFLEKVGLKVSFENWLNLGNEGYFWEGDQKGVRPMGETGAGKACDISLGELVRTNKQRNIKNQSKELDIMG